jgi:microcystin-dependent protein
VNDIIQHTVGAIGTVLAQIKGMPVPDGWLHCNGACYNGEEFPELYRLLRTNRLPRDPQGYFRVPNERTVMPIDALLMLIVRAV